MQQGSLSDSEYQDCEETFRFLDTNHNDRIELSELCSGLSDLGLSLTTLEIKAVLDHFGKQTHESLNFEEYLEFYKECFLSHELTKEEALQLFKKNDLNKDGFLNIYELKAMMIEKCRIMNEDEIHALLRDFDYNQDKKICLTEFMDSIYH